MADNTFTVHAAAQDDEADAAFEAPEVHVVPSLGLVSSAEGAFPAPPDPPGSKRRHKRSSSRKRRDKGCDVARDCIPTALAALLKCGRLGGMPVAASLWALDSATGHLALVDSVGSIRPTRSDSADGGVLLKRALDQQALVFGPLRHVTTTEAKTMMWRLALPVTCFEGCGVAVLDYQANRNTAPKRLRKAVRALTGDFSRALVHHARQVEATSARDFTDSLGSLASQTDPRVIVSECLTHAVDLVHADSGSIMLLDATSGTMHLAASVGPDSDQGQPSEIGAGDGVSGWVLAAKQPMGVEELDGAASRGKRRRRRSAISVPLSDSEGILGVLNVARSKSRVSLGRADMRALQTLGRFSAIMLRRARLAHAATETGSCTPAPLAEAMQARGPDEEAASQRVADLAVQLGIAMEVPERDLESLRVAALLHDVGMATAGDTVNVSGRLLSTFEWGMLKMHPLVGVEILAQVPALADVVPIVRHHHEHWDGSGYVDGIAAEEIPLGARILAVADAYVAMTSERPYRKTLSSGQALAELSSKAGSQFDPVVVRVLAERVLSGSGLPL